MNRNSIIEELNNYEKQRIKKQLRQIKLEITGFIILIFSFFIIISSIWFSDFTLWIKILISGILLFFGSLLYLMVVYND